MFCGFCVAVVLLKLLCSIGIVLVGCRYYGCDVLFSLAVVTVFLLCMFLCTLLFVGRCWWVMLLDWGWRRVTVTVILYWMCVCSVLPLSWSCTKRKGLHQNPTQNQYNTSTTSPQLQHPTDTAAIYKDSAAVYLALVLSSVCMFLVL